MSAQAIVAAIDNPEVVAAINTLQAAAAAHGLHVVVALVLMVDDQGGTVALLEPGANPRVQSAAARALDAAAAELPARMN